MNTTSDRHGSATVTLPSDLEILITRQFDAPAALVFKAWTTPDLVKRWWGFESSEWVVCDIDLRQGGRWRYVTREEGGFEVGFHGEYRAIQAPHRIVFTEVYEGLPVPDPDEAAALTTTVFEDNAGVTTMTSSSLYLTQELRDGHIASGMEGGMQISMNRLEDLVVGLNHAA